MTTAPRGKIKTHAALPIAAWATFSLSPGSAYATKIKSADGVTTTLVQSSLDFDLLTEEDKKGQDARSWA